MTAGKRNVQKGSAEKKSAGKLRSARALSALAVTDPSGAGGGPSTDSGGLGVVEMKRRRRSSRRRSSSRRRRRSSRRRVRRRGVGGTGDEDDDEASTDDDEVDDDGGDQSNSDSTMSRGRRRRSRRRRSRRRSRRHSADEETVDDEGSRSKRSKSCGVRRTRWWPVVGCKKIWNVYCGGTRTMFLLLQVFNTYAKHSSQCLKNLFSLRVKIKKITFWTFGTMHLFIAYKKLSYCNREKVITLFQPQLLIHSTYTRDCFCVPSLSVYEPI